MIVVSTAFMFFFASCARKTTFVGDRVVFGIAAGSFLLWDIREVVLPGPLVTSFINGTVHVLWAIGAVVTLVLLTSIGKKDVSRRIH